MKPLWKYLPMFAVAAILITGFILKAEKNSPAPVQLNTFDRTIAANSNQMVAEGRQIFRFDTFGDEAFWGGTLQLHKAIEGAKFGGVGPGVSPATAAAVGLKIDVDALPQSVTRALKAGQINLNDPAVTLALLKLNSVVGLTGDFNPDGSLKGIAIQCALCHSRVDNSFKAPGLPEGIVGHRLDGWSNDDLNVGAIVALAPNLQPVADLLGVDVPTVQKVLMSWGPGKFDAELFLDGKGFNPKQVTDGVVTGTNVTGAVLVPPAFGKAGVNLHTWTGAWGTVSYWNALVAVLEMHGQGTFFDPRLDNAAQFPIAAAHNFGHVTSDTDLVTSKLPALHFYQLAIPAPQPPQGSFNEEAAKRGDELFSGKAKCTTLPYRTTMDGTGLEPALGQRYLYRQLRGRPRSRPQIPHDPAWRIVDAPEARFLSRRAICHAHGRGEPLRFVLLAGTFRRGEERSGRVFEVAAKRRGKHAVATKRISPRDDETRTTGRVL